ncbi:MAG: V-type ATP synthase subunit A, partial [Oscillospiraceae bacterium]
SMGDWYNTNVAPDWMESRARIMRILQDEAELEEIVKLVGMDALSAPDRLKLEAARSIREDFLHQNAYHEVDTYSSLEKQHKMMLLLLSFFDYTTKALTQGANIEALVKMNVRERIGRFKYIPAEGIHGEYEQILHELQTEIAEILKQKEEF